MIFILQSGSTPAYLKELLVILVLKKPSLAIDDMSNFHPAEGRCVHVLRLVCGWQSREPSARCLPSAERSDEESQDGT